MTDSNHGGRVGLGVSDADVVEILRLANDAHGTRYKLVGRLPGGYQTGAYELADADGARAVLKSWVSSRPIERVAEAAATVEAARAAGWPTPAWLAYGIGPNGVPYEIQEFVTGVHRERLDEATLELLLEVNSRQADLSLPTTHAWSGWVREVLCEDRDRLVSRVAGHSDQGRDLGAVIQTIRDDAGDIHLPETDLVCGVFALENILFGADTVAGVIDVQALGTGSRVIDLAVLHSILELWDQEAAVGRRLRTAAEQIVGPEAFAVCLAVQFLGVLGFGLTHWPDGVAAMSGRAAASLRKLLG